MRRRILFGFGLSLVLLSHAIGQGQLDLDRLDEKFAHQLQRELPGWKHERGKPMNGGTTLLIQYWSLSNRKIKIAISPQKSAEEARDRIQNFGKTMKEAVELSGFGDEAYSWGYEGSNIVFRRGKFVVFVSTYAEVESDPDARSLTPEQRNERQRSEVNRWSREFARHMAAAIDQP